MEFRTVVDIDKFKFKIEPCEQILFVGSCFAGNIGQRFQEEKFNVLINPFGVMYNPVSIYHTISRITSEDFSGRIAFITLGTDHVYVEKATGEIVDNCKKRPQYLFNERILSMEECRESIEKSVSYLKSLNSEINVVLTVSPIRYRKYGYHQSQLSKASLLIAADQVVKQDEAVSYFPAYEIINDELRDYRFYKPDMLHPSEQAVDYIWERLVESCFSDSAKEFLAEWKPIKEALGHKPIHPESEEYKQFMIKTMLKVRQIKEKYNNFAY